jgi:hypothetical protein
LPRGASHLPLLARVRLKNEYLEVSFTLLPNCAISITGMKDASGWAILSLGSVGNAAYNKKKIDVIVDKKVTQNLIGLMYYL